MNKGMRGGEGEEQEGGGRESLLFCSAGVSRHLGERETSGCRPPLPMGAGCTGEGQLNPHDSCWVLRWGRCPND